MRRGLDSSSRIICIVRALGAPVIEAAGTLEVWRPCHIVNNDSGDTVDVESITPVPSPHNVVSLQHSGGDNISFNEDGNIAVASGTEIVMDEAGETFTFMSLSGSPTSTGALRWVQIDSGSYGD